MSKHYIHVNTCTHTNDWSLTWYISLQIGSHIVLLRSWHGFLFKNENVFTEADLLTQGWAGILIQICLPLSTILPKCTVLYYLPIFLCMFYFVFPACKLPVINVLIVSLLSVNALAQIYFKSRVTIQYNIQEALLLSNHLVKRLLPVIHYSGKALLSICMSYYTLNLCSSLVSCPGVLLEGCILLVVQ